MAVAQEVLNFVLNEEFLDHVREIGFNLRKLLKENILTKFPKLVSGVRGIGLMVGLEAVENNEILIKSLIKEKFLL